MFQKPRPKPWYSRWRGVIAGATASIATVITVANMGKDLLKLADQYLPRSVSILLPGSGQRQMEMAVDNILRQRFILPDKIEEIFGKAISSTEFQKAGSRISSTYYDGSPGQLALVYKDGKVIAWTYAPSFAQEIVHKFIVQSGLDYRFKMKELAIHQPKRNFAIFDGSRSEEMSLVQFSDGNPNQNYINIYWYIFYPRTPCFKGKDDGAVVDLSDAMCSGDVAQGAFQAVTHIYDAIDLSRAEMENITISGRIYSTLTTEVSEVELMPIGARLNSFK